MAKCPPQSFPNFTAECIQALQAKLQSEGVNPAEQAANGNASGTASRAGFDIAWKYDQTSQTLVVQCTSSPFYAPCSLINAQINSWILSCYPSDAGESSGATSS